MIDEICADWRATRRRYVGYLLGAAILSALLTAALFRQSGNPAWLDASVGAIAAIMIAYPIQSYRLRKLTRAQFFSRLAEMSGLTIQPVPPVPRSGPDTPFPETRTGHTITGDRLDGRFGEMTVSYYRLSTLKTAPHMTHVHPLFTGYVMEIAPVLGPVFLIRLRPRGRHAFAPHGQFRISGLPLPYADHEVWAESQAMKPSIEQMLDRLRNLPGALYGAHKSDDGRLTLVFAQSHDAAKPALGLLATGPAARQWFERIADEMGELQSVMVCIAPELRDAVAVRPGLKIN